MSLVLSLSFITTITPPGRVKWHPLRSFGLGRFERPGKNAVLFWMEPSEVTTSGGSMLEIWYQSVEGIVVSQGV